MAVARGAGQILLEKARAGFNIEHKGSIDLVTDADRAAEKYVVRELKKTFPHAQHFSGRRGGLHRQIGKICLGNRPPGRDNEFCPSFPLLRRFHRLGEKG